MKEAYTRRNPDGSRSVYYPEANKKYKQKYRQRIKQYKVEFSPSDADQAIVNFLENERAEKGMSANAYIKSILVEYVNNKYK